MTYTYVRVCPWASSKYSLSPSQRRDSLPKFSSILSFGYGDWKVRHRLLQRNPRTSYHLQLSLQINAVFIACPIGFCCHGFPDHIIIGKCFRPHICMLMWKHISGRKQSIASRCTLWNSPGKSTRFTPLRKSKAGTLDHQSHVGRSQVAVQWWCSSRRHASAGWSHLGRSTSRGLRYSAISILAFSFTKLSKQLHQYLDTIVAQ